MVLLWEVLSLRGREKAGKPAPVCEHQMSLQNDKSFRANFDCFSVSDSSLSSKSASRPVSPQAHSNMSFSAPWTEKETVPL